ncbi:hypothetical protein Xmir_03687 [Xenorhabdus miraniensis]|uniref:Uncharacterized protein n=1 Tax=Xenorhabdus miraniensis TaxID=351674 RepID=A0A2D0JL72_9GAMM|nr:hypothetical protein Xmir_03687 [Xenorhabdus miraniensis]
MSPLFLHHCYSFLISNRCFYRLKFEIQIEMSFTAQLFYDTQGWAAFWWLRWFIVW